MTFHGTPRAPPEVMHHVHESPPVMLVPLVHPRRRRAVRRPPLRRHLHRRGATPSSGRRRSFVGRPTTSSRRCTTSPLWVELLPTARDADRLRARRSSSTSARPRLPRTLAARHRVALPRSCSTSGTSTSSTTSCSCARPSGSAASCGRRGDGWLIDGFGPDGVSARVVDVTNRVVRLQTGYLYHYAFAMLIGVAALVTWHDVRGERSDDRLADPLDRHLPAAASARCSSCSSAATTRAARRNIRYDRAAGRRSSPSSSRCSSGSASTMPIPASSSSRRPPGSAAASPTRWASTASRCCSSS